MLQYLRAPKPSSLIIHPKVLALLIFLLYGSYGFHEDYEDPLILTVPFMAQDEK